MMRNLRQLFVIIALCAVQVLPASLALAQVQSGGMSPTAGNAQLPALGNIIANMSAASGDGSTDAAPAIQAALTANAQAGVGCLFLPPPTVSYKIGSTIPVPAGACIDGISGMPTKLKLANGVNAPMFSLASGIGNFTLRNIQLDGNRANNSAGQGILVTGGGGASKVVLENVWAHDFYQNGVSVSDTSQLYVLGGGYYNNGLAGVSLTGGATEFVIQSQAWNNGTHGLGCIGTCTKGWISGVAWDNGQGDPATGAIADNFTGYGSGNSDLVIGPLVSIGGGNNGVHFGGNRISYVGVTIKSPTFYGLVHSTATVYNTGTVATNGTTTVTGTGTSWSSLYPFGGFGSVIRINGTPYTVINVASDTSLTTLTAVSGTASGLSYSMSGNVISSDVTMAAVHAEGGAGYPGVWAWGINGGVVTNEDSSSVNIGGLLMVGSSNVAIAGGTYNNGTSNGVVLDAVSASTYNTGTVTTTNGSPTITGSGTGFLNNVARTGAYFMVSGDTTAYQIQSVDSDTQLTLATNYSCTACGAGKSYTTAVGVNNGISLTGGVINNNGAVGLQVNNTINSSFSGFVANGNGIYGVQDRNVAANNFFSPGLATGNVTAATSLHGGALANMTGDVSVPAGSRAATVTGIQGVSAPGNTGTGNVVRAAGSPNITGNLNVGGAAPAFARANIVCATGEDCLGLFNSSLSGTKGWEWYLATNGTDTNMNLYEWATSGSGLRATFYAGGGLALGSAVDPGAGNLRVGGSINIQSLSTDATHTTRTVCQDTTSKTLYFGSGASGICLGTSSLRYKKNVAPLEMGLSQIMGLKPISYEYKPEFGAPGVKYGFAAEQVETVAPLIVGKDTKGRPNSVDWAAVVPMLVNAVKEQQRMIDKLAHRGHRH